MSGLAVMISKKLGLGVFDSGAFALIELGDLFVVDLPSAFEQGLVSCVPKQAVTESKPVFTGSENNP